MSTSIDLGAGRTIRTIEHLMAALSAHAIDNVQIEVDGPEIPIFDGSSRPWCRALREAGTTALDAPRQALRIAKPVQIARDGGFLRAEPAPRFEVDVSYDILPTFPVMRWWGVINDASFDDEIAVARSFGSLRRRLGLAPASVNRPASVPPVAPNKIDPAVAISDAPWEQIASHKSREPSHEPLLQGWRPWRATLIAGNRVLPWPRFRDEPVRHVTLDMIGDLTLAGAPLVGRVVAHNPSHEKTFALVAALMSDTNAWSLVRME